MADKSGNGNTQAMQSGSTWGAGHTGTAFDTGGTNYMMGGTPRALNVTTALTMMTWAYPVADPGAGENILISHYTASYPFGLESFDYSGASGQPVCYISGGSYAVAAVSKLTLNTWSHVACTYDGTILRLYINGVQVNTAAATGTIDTSGAKLYLGTDPGDNTFQGRIDDVRIFTRALSAKEIQTLMNTPVAP